MNSNVFALIRTKYNTLSVSQRGVADYVLENAETVMTSSLGDLAAACNVSETTIIRFLRKLDCESYQVFRVNIAQELSREKSDPIYEEVHSTDSVGEIITKVIHSTACSIEDSAQLIDPDSMEKLVGLIKAARHIFVIGIGASAALAYDLTHKLTKLGRDASFCHDSHMINIRCSNLTEEDLLIAFSHSGESREILDGAAFAARGGCPVAAVTSYARSSLALRANCVLLSSSQETRYRSDSMTSRIIQMTIIDMMYIALALSMGTDGMERINRSRVAVAKNKT